MSYCRFSSDGGESDVYVYADVHGGITTMVAENDGIEKINHEDAGKIFNDQDAKSALARLKKLKKDGLHVPECAISRLKKEMADLLSEE